MSMTTMFVVVMLVAAFGLNQLAELVANLKRIAVALERRH